MHQPQQQQIPPHGFEPHLHPQRPHGVLPHQAFSMPQHYDPHSAVPSQPQQYGGSYGGEAHGSTSSHPQQSNGVGVMMPVRSDTSLQHQVGQVQKPIHPPQAFIPSQSTLPLNSATQPSGMIPPPSYQPRPALQQPPPSTIGRQFQYPMADQETNQNGSSSSTSSTSTSTASSTSYPYMQPPQPQYHLSQPQQPSISLTNQPLMNGHPFTAAPASVLPGAPDSQRALTTTFPYSSQVPPSYDQTLCSSSAPSQVTHPAYPLMKAPAQPQPEVLPTPPAVSVPASDDDSIDGHRLSPPPHLRVETLTKNASSRIDTAFVPRPTFSSEPINQPGGKRYETDRYTVPPPPYGVYTVLDRGSSSCRFLRISLNQIPTVAHTLKTTSVPFVVVASPFPVQGEYENPVPSVNLNRGSALVPLDSETEGPPRCSRCHSYSSPFMSFPDELSSACNFCGYTFPLPKHYQYALTEYSRLRNSEYADRLKEDSSLLPYERFEIMHGTIDWAAPSAYLQVVPGQPPARTTAGPTGEWTVNPPAVCFAIDASASAQQSGLTAAAIGAVRYALSSIVNPATEVCILTFDQTIKFYPLPRKDSRGQKNVSETPRQIFVVSDTASPFVPLHSSLLLSSATEARAELEALLDELPNLFQAEHCSRNGPSVARSQSCGNAALHACVQLLSSRSVGSIKIFYGGAPDVGVGSIQRMNLGTATNKDQVVHPLHPTSDLASFYSELVADCIRGGIAIDAFIAAPSNKHLSVSTLGYACRRTGGYCNYYGNFTLAKGYERMCMDLARQCQLPQGYDCMFKIRCSRGFSVTKILSAGTVGLRDARTESSDPSQTRMSRVDGDQSLMFELVHDGEVPEDSRAAYIQYAILHTTMDGVRRVRVVTLAVALTNSLSNTFRYTEVDSVLMYFVRKVTSTLISTPGSKYREDLIKKLVEILFSYRFNCAATTSSGQLILPDSMKLLPLYFSALLKNMAFRTTTEAYTDEKDFLLSRFLHLPLHQLIIAVYPRLYVLHRSYTRFKGEKLQRIGAETGLDDEVYLPPLIAVSGERVSTDGIYLLDNGLQLMVYVGMDVDPSVLNELFGTTDLSEAITSTFNCDQHLLGNLGGRIQRAIRQLRKTKGLAHPWQPVVLIRAKSLDESFFIWNLVEDKLGSEPSYVDFLCQLHKSVYVKMEDS